MDEFNETIYISNAGLVILAPFLPRFFQQLGRMEDGSFITAADAERAVHLLQYLASGQQETEEYLLAFNKILCGLPLDHPVPSSIEITAEETDMVNSLLSAVLQNWEKMSNSTIENLRGSFLLRDGRLEEEGDRSRLRVESKGFDILLSFLPWTISVVHLPWMEKRVEVEWRTA